MPREVIKAKCTPYCKRGKPAMRPQLVNEDHHAILASYGSEYRGLVNYYLLAGDVWRLNRLRWVMETSLLKTLAYTPRVMSRPIRCRGVCRPGGNGNAPDKVFH